MTVSSPVPVRNFFETNKKWTMRTRIKYKGAFIDLLSGSPVYAVTAIAKRPDQTTVTPTISVVTPQTGVDQGAVLITIPAVDNVGQAARPAWELRLFLDEDSAGPEPVEWYSFCAEIPWP